MPVKRDTVAPPSANLTKAIEQVLVSRHLIAVRDEAAMWRSPSSLCEGNGVK